jgi:hypothetical protein
MGGGQLPQNGVVAREGEPQETQKAQKPAGADIDSREQLAGLLRILRFLRFDF